MNVSRDGTTDQFHSSLVTVTNTKEAVSRGCPCNPSCNPSAQRKHHHPSDQPAKMQRTLLPLLAALAGYATATTTASASATSSVIDLNLPNLVDGDATVMGSVLGVDATATSYSLTCPTDSSSLDCGLGNGIEVVEGASVLEVHMTQVDIA